MRNPVAGLGALVIAGYAVMGALLMTRWEIAAASGVSFEEAAATMKAAGQPVGYVTAMIFAALGIALALGWLWLTTSPNTRPTGWIAWALWGITVAAGAPAYFMASFGNLNSVGDVFYDWDAKAAFALVLPLYTLSGLGAVIAIAALMSGLLRQRFHRRKPGPLTAKQ